MPMSDLMSVTALHHRKGDGVDALLWGAVAGLRACGLTVAGAIQHARPGPAGCCSDFFLEDLASGAQILVSQPLGRGARGCRLDYGHLAAVCAGIEESLRNGADVLVLNRFGYSEARGDGLRPLIELALDRGVPVLTSVNADHRAAWDTYTDGFGKVVEPTPDTIRAWLQAVVRERGPSSPLKGTAWNDLQGLSRSMKAG